MMNVSKEGKMRLHNGIIVVFLLSFLLAGFHNRMWHEVFASVVPEREKAEGFLVEERKTEVTVYTYGGEIYTIMGNLKVDAPEAGGSEYLLEMNGSVDVQTSDEMNQEKAVSMEENEQNEPSGDGSVSLTVYCENKIYGFYGTAEVIERQGNNVQKIELHGHKEGFYDSEEAL